MTDFNHWFITDYKPFNVGDLYKNGWWKRIIKPERSSFTKSDTTNRCYRLQRSDYDRMCKLWTSKHPGLNLFKRCVRDQLPKICPGWLKRAPQRRRQAYVRKVCNDPAYKAILKPSYLDTLGCGPKSKTKAKAAAKPNTKALKK